MTNWPAREPRPLRDYWRDRAFEYRFFLGKQLLKAGFWPEDVPRLLDKDSLRVTQRKQVNAWEDLYELEIDGQIVATWNSSDLVKERLWL